MARGTKGDSPTRRRNGGGARHIQCRGTGRKNRAGKGGRACAGEQGEKTERESEGERVPGNRARE